MRSGTDQSNCQKLAPQTQSLINQQHQEATTHSEDGQIGNDSSKADKKNSKRITQKRRSKRISEMELEKKNSLGDVAAKPPKMRKKSKNIEVECAFEVESIRNPHSEPSDDDCVDGAPRKLNFNPKKSEPFPKTPHRNSKYMSRRRELASLNNLK